MSRIQVASAISVSRCDVLKNIINLPITILVLIATSTTAYAGWFGSNPANTVEKLQTVTEKLYILKNAPSCRVVDNIIHNSFKDVDIDDTIEYLKSEDADLRADYGIIVGVMISRIKVFTTGYSPADQAIAAYLFSGTELGRMAAPASNNLRRLNNMACDTKLEYLYQAAKVYRSKFDKVQNVREQKNKVLSKVTRKAIVERYMSKQNADFSDIKSKFIGQCVSIAWYNHANVKCVEHFSAMRNQAKYNASDVAFDRMIKIKESYNIQLNKLLESNINADISGLSNEFFKQCLNVYYRNTRRKCDRQSRELAHFVKGQVEKDNRTRKVRLDQQNKERTKAETVQSLIRSYIGFMARAIKTNDTKAQAELSNLFRHKVAQVGGYLVFQQQYGFQEIRGLWLNQYLYNLKYADAG